MQFLGYRMRLSVNAYGKQDGLAGTAGMGNGRIPRALGNTTQGYLRNLGEDNCEGVECQRLNQH